MKFFASIMAILILALSVMPCNDADAADSNAKISLSQKLPAKDPGHSHADDCSPFCTCGCCATAFAFMFPGLPSTALPYVQIEKQSGHISSKLKEIFLPIWQPPRLS